MNFYVGSVTALKNFCMCHYDFAVENLEFVFGLVLVRLLTRMPNMCWAYKLLKAIR